MYIKDAYCISPQKTFGSEGMAEYTSHSSTRYAAIEPNYVEHIPKGLLRRMGKSVRLGVGAGLNLLAKQPKIDGVLMASSNGAIEDCFKFLSQMISYNEGTLTPTHFVQSTPNAPAGQLALMSKTIGYNITHVSSGLAFEGALLDAMMLLEEGEATNLLLGATEELSDCHFVLHEKIAHFKKDDIDALNLFDSNTEGTVYGEGAAAFIVTSEATADQIKIKDIGSINNPEEGDIGLAVDRLLDKNGLTHNDIDALVLGMSGDNRYDYRYTDFADKNFNNQGIYTFKNLVGEYPTSAAFATWLGYQVLKNNPVCKEAIYKPTDRNIKRLLIYNHYYDQYHGFILLEKEG